MKLLKLILATAVAITTAGVVFKLKRKAKKTDNPPKEREQEVHNPITSVENEGPTHINELTSVTPQVREVPVTTDIVDTNGAATTESIDGLAQLRVEKK